MIRSRLLMLTILIASSIWPATAKPQHVQAQALVADPALARPETSPPADPIAAALSRRLAALPTEA
ncbi:MAG TPA: hypothetical protein VGA65_02445, partial [Hyphomicrobium sp.]